MSQSVPLTELLTHREWVRRLARSLVSDAATADDLAQDAWVAALRAPPTDPSAVRGWFRRVLVRLAMNRRRGTDRRAAREQAVAQAGEAPTPADAVARIEEHQHVVEAVLGLPSPARETVVLRYFESLSPAEIAARTGVPASTVRSRLQRALAELRGQLDADQGGVGHSWRAALLLLLLPESGHGARSTRAAKAVAAAAAGAVLVKMKLTLGVVALALLAGLGWFAQDAMRGVETANAPALDEDAATAPAPGERRTRERVEAPSDDDVLVSAPVPAEPTAVQSSTDVEAPPRYSLDITVLGDDGRPAPATRVQFDDPFGGILDLEEVLEPQEEPLEDAAVDRPSEAGTRWGTNRLSMHLTDRNGRLLVSHTQSRVRVFAEKDGQAGASEMLLLNKSESSRVTIRLLAPFEISGTVLDEQGTPVADAFVVVSRPGEYGEIRLGDTWTDARGAYLVAELPRTGLSPDLTVRVATETHQPATRGSIDTTGRAAEVDFTLAGGFVIRGRLVDAAGQPVPNAIVRDAGNRTSIPSGADGTFELPRLPPDAQVIHVRPPTHADRRVRVAAGESRVRDIGDVVLAAGGAVSGIVTDAEGVHFASGSVYLTSLDDRNDILRSASIGTDGRFALRAIGDDEYRLVAVVLGRDGDWGRGRYIEPGAVRAGATDLRLVASDDRTAEVHVLDRQTGEALTVEAVHIDISTATEPERSFRQSFELAGQSQVLVAFPTAGRHRLTITAPGFEVLTIDAVDVLADRAVKVRAELRRRAE